MRDETKIGVVLGLNLAVERLFKKVWDVMHAQVIAHHDPLSALSDDLDAINELIELQRKYIEEIGYDPLEKSRCKADLQIKEDPDESRKD